MIPGQNASQLPTYFVSCCVFLAQTQPEYDAFPLHVVSELVIAPPTLPPTTTPVAGDTTLQRETFARDLASYEALVLVKQGSPENGHHRKHFACRFGGPA